MDTLLGMIFILGMGHIIFAPLVDSLSWRLNNRRRRNTP